MDIFDLLPIGSIVLLEDGKKKLMVTGVKQTDPETNTEYDYSGVLYPEGNLGQDFQFLFNHDNIEEIFFRGYEDPEREDFLSRLDEYYNS